LNIRLAGGAVLNYCFNNLVTHIPMHFLRRGFLRLFNKNIHSSSVILMHTRILNFWKISIAEHVVINQYCLLDCRLYRITIDRHTDIGPYTKIWTLGHNPDSATHALYGSDVNIGHHVWIASGVTVLPGVNLADGTVVAASSLVHKSTAANDIVGGNPAKFLRKRNNDLTYELKFKPILE
jgi:putative colanic acid biosynthesis acetyltransferase WcaF